MSDGGVFSSVSPWKVQWTDYPERFKGSKCTFVDIVNIEKYEIQYKADKTTACARIQPGSSDPTGLRASVSFLTPDKYVHHTYGDLAFDKINYLSPRYLRHQTPNTISHAHSLLFLHRRRVYNPRANRTRLPELDQEAVKA